MHFFYLFSIFFIGLRARYEKIMWEDGNYIDIKCLERAHYDLTGPIPEFYASGTFSGHGVVDGQKVQVTGIREGFVDPMIGFVL